MLEKIKINSIRKKGWKQLKKFDESEDNDREDDVKIA